jgi:hypothetical protein
MTLACPPAMPNCAHIDCHFLINILQTLVNLNRDNVLCIHELSNTSLLDMHINVTLHFHRLLQPLHLVCSVETCKILAVMFQFSPDTIMFCMQRYMSRKHVWRY